MKPVGEMSCAVISEKPREFDFSEGYCETWEYYEASDCQECGKILVFSGEEKHRYIVRRSDCEGYVCNEGPMMNFWYPLPDYFADVWEIEEAAKRLVGVNLCIVENLDDGEYGLALTGGGMDLSWDICEAYMLLGYLPPVHFCSLPNFAGMKLTKKNAWIIAGCNRSLRISKEDAQTGLRRMRILRAALKARKERK